MQSIVIIELMCVGLKEFEDIIDVYTLRVEPSACCVKNAFVFNNVIRSTSSQNCVAALKPVVQYVGPHRPGPIARVSRLRGGIRGGGRVIPQAVVVPEAFGPNFSDTGCKSGALFEHGWDNIVGPLEWIGVRVSRLFHGASGEAAKKWGFRRGVSAV